jgi:hypothetical protein
MWVTDDSHARAIGVRWNFQQRFQIPGRAGDRDALAGWADEIGGHVRGLAQRYYTREHRATPGVDADIHPTRETHS